MNYQTIDLCRCTNCPGETCACGCQAEASVAPVNAAGAQCSCGTGCGCEGAEQGCLCR